MKKHNKNSVIKLSEKFDKQLLNLLSEELSAVREARAQILKSLNRGSNDELMVA